MAIMNVTHTDISEVVVPQNILLQALQRPTSIWYGSTHNQRLALPAVNKQILKNGFLSVLRGNMNAILKRFPQTPSKVGLTPFLEILFLFLITLPISVVIFQKNQYTETMSEVAKGRRKSTKKLSAERKASTVVESDILQVFDYWISVCKPTARRKPVLDEKRRIAIGAAIHDYGIEQCKNAIQGCTMSDFHMGRNKANKRYDDVELILRDSQHIEQFLELFEKTEAVDW